MSCNYIDYPIYTPGLDLALAEGNVSYFLQTAAPLEGFMPECYQAIQRLVCSYYYPSCHNSTGSIVRPCVSTCATVNSVCSFVISTIQDQLTPYQRQILNCTATDNNNEFIWAQTASPSLSPSPSSSPSSDTCFTLENLKPVCAGTNTTGGKCELFSNDKAPRTHDLCEPFISDDVYVSNFEAADSLANSTLWLIRKIYPIMPLGCYKAILSLSCQTAFPSCRRTTDSDNSTLLSPVAPCQSLCEHTNEVCGEFFGLVGQPIVDCRQFPTDKCQPNLFADSSKTFIAPYIDSCPFPMAKKPNPTDKDHSCWIPCPDPTYSPKQWDDLIIVGQVFASISFVLCLFLVVTGFVDSVKRKFPSNIHIFLAMSAGLSTIAFFINGSSAKTTTWCNDATTYANNQNNSRCAAQGFIFILFTLSILTWWIVLAFNTFLAVVLMTKFKGIKYLSVYYHLFAWGIPLIFTISLIATNSIGYTPPASWCFITGAGIKLNEEITLGTGLDYGLFYIPIGIGLGLAVIFLIAVFAKIFMISKASKSISSQSTVAIKAQRRIITLIALMLVLFALVFEWRFALDAAVKDGFKDVDFAWGLCKIKQQLQIDDGNPGHCPGDKFPKVFNYSHTMFSTFLCSSLGLFIFLIFGTDIRIYRMWANIFIMAKQGETDKLMSFIKDNSKTSMATPTTTGGSRPTSGNSISHSRNSNSSHNSNSPKNSHASFSSHDSSISSRAPLHDDESSSSTQV